MCSVINVKTTIKAQTSSTQVGSLSGAFRSLSNEKKSWDCVSVVSNRRPGRVEASVIRRMEMMNTSGDIVDVLKLHMNQFFF